MKDEERELYRTYHIEEYFDSYEEYKQYVLRELADFRNAKKKHNTSLSKYVPTDFDVVFSTSVKHPRLRVQRGKGTIALVLPDRSFGPKKKQALREANLTARVGVIQTNEIMVAEQFAMRRKILDKKVLKTRNDL